MLTTYAALVAATVMGVLALLRLSSQLDVADTFWDIISAIALVIYILAIFAIYCMDFVYLCYHYNKTMYSSQGYLTHTLPVSPAATFGAKILVFFTWMFISALLLVLSVVIFMQIGTGGELLRELGAYSWNDFNILAYGLFGMSAPALLLMFLAEAVLSILQLILWITASMAIGQLFQKSRTAATILAAFCFSVASQIISTLFLVVSGYGTGMFLEGDIDSFMSVSTSGSLVMNAVFVAVLYGICVYINKKKLNLE